MKSHHWIGNLLWHKLIQPSRVTTPLALSIRGVRNGNGYENRDSVDRYFSRSVRNIFSQNYFLLMCSGQEQQTIHITLDKWIKLGLDFGKILNGNLKI